MNKLAPIHTKFKHAIDKINLVDAELNVSTTEYFNALQSVNRAKQHLNMVLAKGFLKHGQAEFDDAISNEIVAKRNRGEWL